MIGVSGTASEKSLFTRIFSPLDGTLMCLYAMASPARGLLKSAAGSGRRAIILAFDRATLLIWNKFALRQSIFSQVRVNHRHTAALHAVDRSLPVFPKPL